MKTKHQMTHEDMALHQGSYLQSASVGGPEIIPSADLAEKGFQEPRIFFRERNAIHERELPPHKTETAVNWRPLVRPKPPYSRIYRVGREATGRNPPSIWQQTRIVAATQYLIAAMANWVGEIWVTGIVEKEGVACLACERGCHRSRPTG